MKNYIAFLEIMLVTDKVFGNLYRNHDYWSLGMGASGGRNVFKGAKEGKNVSSLPP